MEAAKETLLTRALAFPVDAFLMAEHAQDYTYAAHHHDYIELLFVLEGGILLSSDDQRMHAYQGDLAVFRGGTPHAVDGTDGPHSRILVVQFLPDLLEGVSEQDPGIRHIRSFLSPGTPRPLIHRDMHAHHAELYQLVIELYEDFIAKKPGYELFVRSCLYRLIVFLLRNGLLEDPNAADTQRDLSRIAPLLAWLDTHFREDIRLTDAAGMLNFSYAYTSRLFQRITGRSFRSYVEHVRVSEAERWIRSGRMSVTQAAHEAGFGSASAFARSYRKLRGQAPGGLKTKTTKRF